MASNLDSILADYTVSLMKFANILYKCSLCASVPVILTSKDSFLSHMNNVHLIPLTKCENCTKCKLKFECKVDLKAHMRNTHGETNDEILSNASEDSKQDSGIQCPQEPSLKYVLIPKGNEEHNLQIFNKPSSANNEKIKHIEGSNLNEVSIENAYNWEESEGESLQSGSPRGTVVSTSEWSRCHSNQQEIQQTRFGIIGGSYNKKKHGLSRKSSNESNSLFNSEANKPGSALESLLKMCSSDAFSKAAYKRPSLESHLFDPTEYFKKHLKGGAGNNQYFNETLSSENPGASTSMSPRETVRKHSVIENNQYLAPEVQQLCSSSSKRIKLVEEVRQDSSLDVMHITNPLKTLKQVLGELCVVQADGCIARDSLLEAVSEFIKNESALEWGGVCNKAVREVFPNALSQRKGRFKKTYFFGITLIQLVKDSDSSDVEDDRLTIGCSSSYKASPRNVATQHTKLLAVLPEILISTSINDKVHRDNLLDVVARKFGDPTVRDWKHACNRAIKSLFTVGIRRLGKYKDTVFFGVKFKDDIIEKGIVTGYKNQESNKAILENKKYATAMHTIQHTPPDGSEHHQNTIAVPFYSATAAIQFMASKIPESTTTSQTDMMKPSNLQNEVWVPSLQIKECNSGEKIIENKDNHSKMQNGQLWAMDLSPSGQSCKQLITKEDSNNINSVNSSPQNDQYEDLSSENVVNQSVQKCKTEVSNSLIIDHNSEIVLAPTVKSESDISNDNYGETAEKSEKQPSLRYPGIGETSSTLFQNYLDKFEMQKLKEQFVGESETKLEVKTEHIDDVSDSCL